MKALLAFGILFTALPSTAGELSVDTRCFSDANGRIRLEFRTYEDEGTGWVGGQVRYGSAGKYIPIVLDRTETLMDVPGRPSEFAHHWLEIVDGKVNGTYRLVSQGAVIYSFSYTSRASGKTTDFPEQSLPDDSGACP